MKAGWEECSLRDVLRLEYGKPLPSADRNPVGAYPVYGANGEIDRTNRFFYNKPSIIVGRKGSAGELKIAEENFWPLDVSFFVTFEEKKHSLRFLFYLLKNLDLPKFAKGVKPGINRNDVYAQTVFVPPLSEQQRIVGILDEAFENIVLATINAETNLNNAGTLFESHLNDIFSKRGEGWRYQKVSDLANHSLGKMLDKAKNRGEKKPYLRNFNVRWFDFDLSDLLEMPFEPEETEKYMAEKGDVLICEGGYPGRAAIWEKEYPIYFQKALHRVRFHKPEHSKWFVYFLFACFQSGTLREYFSGTGIQHFTGEALSRFVVPVPPTQEIQAEVAKFDALAVETQRLASVYHRKLAALDELKKSLLHRAFTGQL